jgi:hypothetical protein
MDEPRVSIYIVTYRNPVDLNRNIASLLASEARARIYVINNHSKFSLEPEHEREVTVLHNALRPDFSTGHLSRNWNQALLHGFRDLKSPANDVVVTVQDDVVFKADWFKNLIDLHQRYSFITMGPGDTFCSYLPEAVRKVGMWDERFCNLAYHEGDYFLRSLIHNRERCSINDLVHGRQHNVVEGNALRCSSTRSVENEQRADSLLITSPHWNVDRKEAHLSSIKYHPLSETVFRHKWGIGADPWTSAHHEIRHSRVPNYIMYPFFEKDVEELREKNYIVAEEGPRQHWEEIAGLINRSEAG